MTIQIQPAPVACTLSPDDFKERAQWLRELTSRAQISHRTDGLSAELRYRVEAANDVEELVRRESSCCGFLKFTLLHSADAIILNDYCTAWHWRRCASFVCPFAAILMGRTETYLGTPSENIINDTYK